MAKFEPMTAVRVDLNGRSRPWAFPFEHGQMVLFLGEVRNQPGYAVVACDKGAVVWGYSIDYFVSIEDWGNKVPKKSVSPEVTLTHRLRNDFEAFGVVYPAGTAVCLEERRFHLLDESGKHLPLNEDPTVRDNPAIFDISMALDSFFDEV